MEIEPIKYRLLSSSSRIPSRYLQTSTCIPHNPRNSVVGEHAPLSIYTSIQSSQMGDFRDVLRGVPSPSSAAHELDAFKRPESSTT